MQNKIKELRTQLSITQRELADMVGTSQQQIQRIETGKVAAKLGLAQAISAVLKKPLNAVFPDSDNLLQKLRNQGSRSSDELKDIAASGIEMDGRFWTVKLWLRGQKDYLLLPISPADKRRFYSYFEESTVPDHERFFVFDSEQHRYAINAREVIFHQFLFDGFPPIHDDEDSDTNEGSYGNVHITMVNGGPVIELCCESEVSENDEFDDIGQLNALFDTLELEPESTERYQITDEDGEDAFIRIGSVAMVRISLDVLDSVEEDND
ncbi:MULTISPECIES: helix-turn-helix transcriptional regulator [Enterobacteriaceae]|uniref:helix-turn-helix transcriptional regulator n=1 Tax=Enterobacteriaceae TaxID=543 RepID=UPI0016593089|nr:helix-turn-helix transcriptional regulator [Enterobacter roggenkampii]MCQ4390557.1 helix-turn-helix transcriptional regulator [Enterobacter roggenkampii]QNQ25600.1 helix-turn-helix transcriptional regulator [Enterobacter roggenkampii]HDR2385906.1 helix-turn-helix transcriptional regulator [Enterobacter roggenkampii]